MKWTAQFATTVWAFFRRCSPALLPARNAPAAGVTDPTLRNCLRNPELRVRSTRLCGGPSWEATPPTTAGSTEPRDNFSVLGRRQGPPLRSD